jgi:outer membrane receptor protein involved in Fe transport
LTYQLAGNVFLKASAGSAFRAPTLNELYWNDGWMFGNPNLKPEKSFSYELTLEKHLGADYLTRVSYYSAMTTDMILWDWQSSTIETRAKNVGRVDTEGVEFELVRALGDKGKAFINYTYQTAVDREDFDLLAVGKTIRYTPRNKYNLGLTYNGTGVYVRYVGERFADQYNTVKLPAFTVVDLRYENPLLTLSVDNLFDEKYSEAVGNDPTTYAARNYPMPGRNYKIGVKLAW